MRYSFFGLTKLLKNWWYINLELNEVFECKHYHELFGVVYFLFYVIGVFGFVFCAIDVFIIVNMRIWLHGVKFIDQKTIMSMFCEIMLKIYLCLMSIESRVF